MTADRWVGLVMLLGGVAVLAGGMVFLAAVGVERQIRAARARRSRS